LFEDGNSVVLVHPGMGAKVVLFSGVAYLF